MNKSIFINVANSVLKNELIPKYASKKCNDDIVGYFKGNNMLKNDLWFEIEKRAEHISEINITNNSNKSYDKTVVIVLESPHVDEYSYQYVDNNKKSDFFHPALGKTGFNLQMYFPGICSWILSTYYPNDNNTTWRIILMNSIQYQCSLGVDTMKYRDHMWLKLWFNNKCSLDFFSRIKKYKPDIIFNFCTKGEHLPDSQNKKNISKKFIENVLNEIPKEVTEILKMRSHRDKFSIRECVTYNLITSKKKLTNLQYLIEGNHPSSWWNENSRKLSMICCKHGNISNEFTFDKINVEKKIEE